MLYAFIFFFFGKPFDLKAPIPAADWHVAADPAKGIADAVVLEDHTLVKVGKVQRYRRVRVLSEAGKAAVVVIDPGERMTDYKCRIVQASGAEARVSGKRELVDQEGADLAYAEPKTRALLPPGLSADCIVECSWTIPVNFSGQAGGRRWMVTPFGMETDILIPKNKNPIEYEARIDEPYLVLRKTFENTLSKLYPHREVVSNPSLRFRWENKTKVFEGLPPTKQLPFGMPNQSDHVAVFRVTGKVGKYAVFDAYWGWAALEYKKSIEYTPVVGSYKSWSEEVLKGLPEDPTEGMALLLSKFRERFHVKKQQAKRPDPFPDPILAWFKSPLRKTAKEGYGEAAQLNEVFLNLLRQTSIPYRIVLAADQADPRFDAKALYLDDLQHVLVAQVTPGGLVYVDPSQEGYPVGQLPQSVSGAAALVIDPRPSGSFSWTVLPTQGPVQNQITSEYSAQLATTGDVTCQVTRTAKGLYASQIYRACAALDQTGRDAWLGKLWNTAPLVVQRAGLEGLDAFQGETLERVQLTWAATCAEASCRLQPFPASLAMEAPEVWPEPRDQDLYLPFAGKHSEQCNLEVPEGWQLVGDNAWSEKNEIGEIRFEAVQSDGRIEARCETLIYKDVYPRALEPALKQFLAWQATAKTRTLELKR